MHLDQNSSTFRPKVESFYIHAFRLELERF